MECKAVKLLLVDYLNNGIEAKNKYDIEVHLTTCLDCKKELDNLAHIQQRFSQTLKNTMSQKYPDSTAIEKIKKSVIFNNEPDINLNKPRQRKIINFRDRRLWITAVILISVLIVLWRILPSRTDMYIYGIRNLYLINADGTGLNLLTEIGDAHVYKLIWSPLGDKLAYRYGEENLYVINTDGSNKIKLPILETLRSLENIPELYGGASDPVWSPDGSKIAFRYFTRTESTTIIDNNDSITKISYYKEGFYLINPDGTELITLMESKFSEKNNIGGNLSWSPDGSKLAFSDDNLIYTISPDGTNLVKQLDFSLDISNISWSPDSTKIAFINAGNYPIIDQLFVLNLIDSSVKQLSNYNGYTSIENPCWSPDGSRIVCSAREKSIIDNTWDLYVFNADGSQGQNITNSSSINELFPVWSPNNNKIAYSSLSDIYLIDVDGSNPIKLTNMNSKRSIDCSPVWSPDGTKIAFIYEKS